MQEINYLSHDKKTQIHACIWLPEGEIKAVVQIIHGMAEYAARYAPFAEFLVSHGFAVCGEDHLGHGGSVKSKEDLGYFTDKRDTDIVIEDINSLRLEMQKRFEGKPYFVLGHSMGSFYCRKYISVYGKGLAGAVIVGSGFKGKLTLNSALALVKLNALFCGWKHRSNFIRNLAFGSYNKKFDKNNDKAWLSVNEENIARYRADEYCGFDFTNNGYTYLFGIIKKACSDSTIKSVPKDLPVIFLSGSEDPVGDYGKGVIKAKNKFVKAGVKQVSIKLYEGYRHEIMNDDCKDEVFKDILEFLNGCLGA